MTEDFFYTVGTNGSAEFKDRGSKFLALSFPIESASEFKQILEKVKKEHPKANHHCFAYRLGLDGNTFRVSDDGEPAGTAGKPILGQIDSKQLTNTLVIVVRYFGGTLLGVPGLINAYKSVTALVLQTTPIVQKQIEVQYSIQFDYTQLNSIMQILKQYNVSVIEKDLTMFCRLKVGIPKARAEEVLYHLNDLQNIQLEKM